MLQTVSLIGGGGLLILAIVWLAWRGGKSMGASAQREDDARATADSLKRQQDAIAKGPRNFDDALNRLGEGKF
jgi:hypothetical protein